MQQLLLATDRAFDSQSGRGGWAAVFFFSSRIWSVSGHLPKAQSSHYAELTAVNEALRHLTLPCEIHLLTDSQRIVQEFKTGKYEEADTRNSIRKAEKQLWIEVLKLSVPHALQVSWVKGHSGHRLNELANTLAQAAAQLPFDAQGESVQRRKVKKEEVQQAQAEAQLQPLGEVLDEREAAPQVAVVMRVEGLTWKAQVTGLEGVDTLSGELVGVETIHARFFAALRDLLSEVPPGSAVTVLSSGIPFPAQTWLSKAPAKLHRTVLKEARAVAEQRRQQVSFASV